MNIKLPPSLEREYADADAAPKRLLRDLVWVGRRHRAEEALCNEPTGTWCRRLKGIGDPPAAPSSRKDEREGAPLQQVNEDETLLPEDRFKRIGHVQHYCLEGAFQEIVDHAPDQAQLILRAWDPDDLSIDWRVRIKLAHKDIRGRGICEVHDRMLQIALHEAKQVAASGPIDGNVYEVKMA